MRTTTGETATHAGMLAVGAALSAGCSFFLVDAPAAKVAPEVYPMCTEARTAPVADAIVAGSTASFAAETLLIARGFDGEGLYSAEVALVALAVAAVYGPAAWVGFRRTGECRRQRQIYVERQGDPDQLAGEGQACHPEAGCQPGLICASGICVRPPESPAAPPGGEIQ